MVASSSTCCAEGEEKGTEAASCWQGKQKTRGQPERRHRDYSVQEAILEEVERVMKEVGVELKTVHGEFRASRTWCRTLGFLE